jgi:hypothetical protein
MTIRNHTSIVTLRQGLVAVLAILAAALAIYDRRGPASIQIRICASGEI